MSGYIDLHSHWIAGIDDGVKTIEDGRALLVRLKSIGFAHVVASPHMRPGMFENDKASLEGAYERTCAAIGLGAPDLPTVGLGCEHYVDDVILARVLGGQGVPYPGGKAVLLEFGTTMFPAQIQRQLMLLVQKGLIPVIAHPERYEPIWRDPNLVDTLLDVGACLQLDVAALVGKYGRAPKKTAEALVAIGAYQAASSDAHKPSDVDAVAEGILRLKELAGDEEATFLLRGGPEEILAGQISH